MGGGFENVVNKATSTYEKVKSAVAEKWEGFKKKFEGTKSEMSQEVMDAKSPEDLIALGKKLQEKGEALKLEKDGVEKEEVGNDHEEALKDNETFDKEKAHGEALEENSAFDEAEATKKASEEAEKARIQAEEDAKKIAEDAKKAEELLAKIKSGNLGAEKPEEVVNEEKNETIQQSEATSKEFSQEDMEKIYGLNEKDMQELMDSRGYPKGGGEGINDSNRKERMEEFHNKQGSYDQVRVKLFDRVLSGTASENEIRIAENHAIALAKTFRLDGFSGVPQAWYSNERLASAMANSSENNKKWVDYVKKYYTSEQLKKGGYEKIGEDGFAHTYSEKGF